MRPPIPPPDVRTVAYTCPRTGRRMVRVTITAGINLRRLCVAYEDGGEAGVRRYTSEVAAIDSGTVAEALGPYARLDHNYGVPSPTGFTMPAPAAASDTTVALAVQGGDGDAVVEGIDDGQVPEDTRPNIDDRPLY